MSKNRSPIVDALNAESYQFLSTIAPDLLNAIEGEIGNGKTAEQIKRMIIGHVGPEREALANRAFQAAQHVERTQTT